MDLAVNVHVTLPRLDLAIDLPSAAREAAAGMRDFWAERLDAGEQPDGEPLPKNKQGQPLGRGRGTLVRRWRVRSIGGRRNLARALVEPYQTGRYVIAVARLRARGLRFQGFEGASKAAWTRVAGETAKRAIDRALAGTKEWTDVVQEGE
jgi:hypothetical protein